jgi:MFS family permease
MAAPTAGAREPEFSRAYTRYALGLLLVVYIFNFVDRQIVTILMQAIKEDLQLSDAQLGFFSGTSFAIFYATLGIPIARFADRSVRRNIIATALLVWSAMTALQGAARSFGMLAIARIGVGIGEAGCSPPGHSMISDLFPPNRRATALSIYALGIPIGSAIGLFAGGWIREFFGWRTAFVVVGLPGVALALLVRLTLREPTRGHWDATGGRSATEPAEPIGDVARFMLGLPAFLHLSFAGALHAFYGYGAAFFNPPFFERVHGFTPGQLGTLLGLVSITSGVAGTFLGGYLTDRLATRDPRWYAWAPGIATFVAIPFVFLFYLWPHPMQAVALSLIPALLGGMYLGPTFAVTQSMVPARWRAQASAVLLLILNLIGLGLGPQFVGFLSDLLAPRYGVESVRYALLLTVSVGAAWASVHYVMGARTLRRDLEAKDALC